MVKTVANSTDPDATLNWLGKVSSGRSLVEIMKARKRADPETLEKPGVAWSEIRSQLKTLDMIQFRGWDWVSRGMIRFERRALGADGARFTHGALVLRGSDFPKTSRFYDDTKLYAFECTDPKEDDVVTEDGRKFQGVQLRDLDAVVANYDCSEVTELAWMRMHDRVRPNVDPEELERVVEHYLDRKFEWNPLYLLGALYEGLRPWRGLYGRARSSEKLFCSQHTALVLQDLGVLDPDVNPLDVLPSDFRSPDQMETLDKDEEIPVLFDEVKTFTAFPKRS